MFYFLHTAATAAIAVSGAGIATTAAEIAAQQKDDKNDDNQPLVVIAEHCFPSFRFHWHDMP